MQCVTLIANSLARLAAFETPLGEQVMRELGKWLARVEPSRLTAAQAAMIGNTWAKASLRDVHLWHMLAAAIMSAPAHSVDFRAVFVRVCVCLFVCVCVCVCVCV